MTLSPASDGHKRIPSLNSIIPDRGPITRTLQHLERQEPPEKEQSGCTWAYPVYHRLSTFVVITNVTAATTLGLTKNLLNKPQICLQAVAMNLFVAALIRQDHVINLLYYILGLTPHSVPLCVRRHIANLYHLGGIHSGAAIAAGAWFAVFNVAAVRSNTAELLRDGRAILIISLAVILDLLLLSTLLLSLPMFRARYHNTWEGAHRLSGWLLLLTFWFYLASDIYILSQLDKVARIPPKVTLYTNAVFYFLIGMTLVIILPWIRLRKVKPRYQKLSNHAIQLHFDDWHVAPCKTSKFSTSPIMEWHAFAGIPSPDGTGHSVIVSRAGDWTSTMIDMPPEYLYTKGVPTQGVLYMARIFRTILCVGTGSGIAPILGLSEIPNTKFRILWSARDPRNTYSKGIIQSVLRFDRNAVILDTLRIGRCDLTERAASLCRAGEIEAVFVISNAETTRAVVQGLRARGILAYGPIFDS